MKKVIIHTDGSCLGNPGPGGWAAVLRLANSGYRREICGGFRKTTNNRMEITAVIESLSALKEQCEVVIFTDSQYVSDAINKGWIYGWLHKNWVRKNGETVPNADLWKKILALLARHQVTFNWLRGHDGSPEYTLGEGTRTERGTDIVLHIDSDSTEFLEQERVDTLLRKYCRFLPVPVISGKEREWKDGKWQDTDRDLVINSTEPQWTKKPSELTDEDYLAFYRELYPGDDDPLFWIHLNVDYPFTLTGILYFPKIKSNFDINRKRIQLYSNQVFVTDSVEGVVPEFMTLMQGVIDSPDIPLNVSRSYLQADTAVKKISGYITKKVA